MKRKQGFIGLGNMGGPMAENILRDFGSLVVFNRSQQKCLELAEKGATIAKSVVELTEQVDVIFLCLPGPNEVKTIVTGDTGIFTAVREGQIIVDFSTIDPETSIKLAHDAAAKGVIYLDVPVSGGGVGAKNGTLSLMFGATDEEINALDLLSYFQAVGNTFHFIGKRGGGSAIKIINNYIAFATQVINGEAIVMADALGLDLETFYNVVTSSSGNNAILNAKAEKVKTNDFEPGFALDLVMKDLELARQLCQDAQIPNFSLNTAIQFYRKAQHQGYGQKDSSSVIDVIRKF